MNRIQVAKQLLHLAKSIQSVDKKVEPAVLPVDELKSLARLFISWFQVEGESPTKMEWSTREHGDKFSKTTGYRDTKAAANFAAGATSLGCKTTIEEVDEWVYVIVEVGKKSR